MSFEKWRKLAARLTHMEPAERQSRIRQEIAKRTDGLLTSLGFNFGRHVRQLQTSKVGNFFFSPQSVNGCLELIQQRLPGRADQIIEQAERIVQHRFALLGYADLDYGSPIDWHLDPVHGKRAPKKIFYRVRYLDFAEVGDSKIIWELNRHQHFVTLAKAHRLTGRLTNNARYVDEILRQWRDWWAENPYAIGVNWASSLEVAFRSLSWLWTIHLLRGAPGLPDFRDEWLRGLALHGRHIERYLSTYFSPNTHLLGEGVALFFLGVLCPELESAERWKTTGWKIVLEESRRQIRADGFHFEQSIYYHVYALDFFLHAAVLASVNEIALPKEFEETLAKMLEALSLLGRAGAPPRFGDDDGGRLFDPRRNRSEHMLDPLSTGAILFNRGDYKAVAAQLQEETIWLLGTEGVKIWDELEAMPPSMDSAALPDAGFYLLSSEKPATQLVVDCGPMGTQSGGHGHADALSVVIQSKGQNLLIDPGTYEYVGEGGERALFRGTSMHNTLRIDGVDQAEIATAFSWSRLTESKVEKWIRGHGFDLLEASHDGYERLPQPVRHRRCVFSLRNGLYFVRDRVGGQGTHRLEASWHLAPEMQLIADGVFGVKGSSQGLALLPVEGHGWAQEMHKQSCSPAYGRKAPMIVMTFSRTEEVPAEFCCAIVTLQEVLRGARTFLRIVDCDADGATGYRYVANGPMQDEEYSIFFNGSRKAWRSGGISSDAEFVCWVRSQSGGSEHDDFQRIILVNGSRAEIDGGPSLCFKRTVSWGESIVKENSREVFSSEMDALEDEFILNSPLGSAPSSGGTDKIID
jgi:hypothetical protein